MSDLSDPNKPWENDPVWLGMREEFAKFDEILDEKDPKKFTETYLRLQSIQLQHGRSIKPELNSFLPYEVIVESKYFNNALYIIYMNLERLLIHLLMIFKKSLRTRMCQHLRMQSESAKRGIYSAYTVQCGARCMQRNGPALQ
jgi:hypothetical protein